jgi:hypothetical protein
VYGDAQLTGDGVIADNERSSDVLLDCQDVATAAAVIQMRGDRSTIWRSAGLHRRTIRRIEP